MWCSRLRITEAAQVAAGVRTGSLTGELPHAAGMAKKKIRKHISKYSISPLQCKYGPKLQKIKVSYLQSSNITTSRKNISDKLVKPYE